MIDNVTGKATRVNVRPMQLETILRTNTSRHMVAGWLVMQLGEAAKRLWPEFVPGGDRVFDPGEDHLVGFPEPPMRAARDPRIPFVPRWRRWVTGDDDGGS